MDTRPTRANVAHRQSAFIISEFANRTGRISFRVMGSLNGRRIRENFPTKPKAEARRFELEGLRLGMAQTEAPRVTTLTTEQIKAAEWLFARTPEPAEVRRAFEWWETSGRALADARAASASVTVATAAKQFREYVNATPSLRHRTRQNLNNRVGRFADTLADKPLAEVTSDNIESYVNGRGVSPISQGNDKRAIGRFFSWCVARPQRFIGANPASEVRVDVGERPPPQIYSLRQVVRILAAARRFKSGYWLKTVVLTLFGGMRPTEAIRFRDEQLIDGHIRLDNVQTKTGKPRIVEADPVLLAWLKVCPEGVAKNPVAYRCAWDEFKALAKVDGEAWIADGLRHTAISHYFRRCGSYGLTAEWAGNSEAVIRAHYAARTSSADSAAYWTLFPDRKVRRAARAALAAEKKALGKGRRRAV